MKPAPSCAAESDLIAAGKTLAATADPDKDLLNFANDFRKLSRTLKFIGERSEQVYFAAEDKRDTIAGVTGDIDRANLAYQNDIDAARRAAALMAQKALVELSRLIGELQREAK